MLERSSSKPNPFDVVYKVSTQFADQIANKWSSRAFSVQEARQDAARFATIHYALAFYEQRYSPSPDQFERKTAVQDLAEWKAAIEFAQQGQWQGVKVMLQDEARITLSSVGNRAILHLDNPKVHLEEEGEQFAIALINLASLL